MPSRLPSYSIIKDTREKEGQGWFFDAEEKRPGKCQILGTEVSCLDAADYSIKGATDLIRIERKFGMSELFGNMSPVANKERFEREMEKLRGVKYKYLIIEDCFSNDLLSLSVPQMVRGMPLSTVVKWIYELQMEYGIVPIPAGNCGKRIAKYLFELAARKHL